VLFCHDYESFIILGWVTRAAKFMNLKVAWSENGHVKLRDYFADDSHTNGS